MNLINYLLLNIFIFTLAYFFYKIINKLTDNNKIISDDELQCSIKEKKEEEKITAINDKFELLFIKNERSKKRNFFITLFLFVVLLGLIVAAIYNNFRISFYNFIDYAYFIVPGILLYTFFDFLDYIKKK